LTVSKTGSSLPLVVVAGVCVLDQLLFLSSSGRTSGERHSHKQRIKNHKKKNEGSLSGTRCSKRLSRQHQVEWTPKKQKRQTRSI